MAIEGGETLKEMFRIHLFAQFVPAFASKSGILLCGLVLQELGDFSISKSHQNDAKLEYKFVPM